MKRKIWSLMLCLALICCCFVGCGNKDAKDEEQKKEAIAPEEYLESKFTDFADSVAKAFNSGTDAVPSNKKDGTGMDINLELAIGEQVAAAYGLEGLKNIGLLFSFDWKEAMQGIVELSLNHKSIAEADVYANKDSLFVNLPKYSKDFMMMSMEELLGMSMDEFSSQITSSTEGMPTPEDMAALWTKTSKDFIACFQHEEMKEKAEAGFGDYAFTGDQYVSSAELKDIQSVMEELFQELKKYPALEVEEPDFSESSDGKFYCIYYEGEKDQYAWMLSEDRQESAGVGFISAEKGFCLYVKQQEETEVVLYSVKESASKGKIVLVDKDEEYVLNYENYTKNGVDLSAEIEGTEFTASIEKKKDSFSADFSISAYGIVASGTLESNQDKMSIVASVAMQGINFGSLTLECKNRDYADFQLPASYVDAEAWNEGLDIEKLNTDCDQLINEFPFLKALFPNIY